VDRVERCRTPPPRDHHGEEEEEEEEEGARMETAADAMEREEVGGGQDGADDRARIEEKDLRNIVVLRVSRVGGVGRLLNRRWRQGGRGGAAGRGGARGESLHRLSDDARRKLGVLDPIFMWKCRWLLSVYCTIPTRYYIRKGSR